MKVQLVKRQGFWSTIAEMIGRIAEDRGLISRNSMSWALYTNSPSVDYAHCNYWLTRAIFYASEVQDPQTGRWFGKDFLLGAGFAKPIINSAAAFAIGKLPEVKSDEDSKQADDANTFLENNKSLVFTWVRNGMRDGDGYIKLNKDGSATLVGPHKVSKVIDPVSGELLGYDITSYTKEGENESDVVKYVEELRTTSPFRVVKKYVKDEANGSVVAGTEDKDFPDQKRPLPIIPFHNEQEPDQLYGNTELQNVYVDMANYHSVLENAVKNNIYNSNAIPILTGIENVTEFIKENGSQRDDGTYEMRWNADKLLMGGKGFGAQIVGGVANANDADKLLNIFFWKIAQGSETPEFVFGTAVSSSKASVSEQMPIAVMKGQRKQTQLNGSIRNLVATWFWYQKFFQKAKYNPSLVFELKWMPIVDDDMKLNIEIVNTLSEQGCITDATKMLLLNMNKYVPDIDAEVEKAHKENEEKQKLTDPYATSQTGDPNKDKLTPEQQKIAEAKAQ